MKGQILDLLRTVGKDFKLDDDPDKKLMGMSGQLDSLDFVRFLVLCESAINQFYDSFISLVDDKALSEKNSPFRSLNTLAEYIERNLGNENISDNRY